ncbi:MAG: hypothetical protein J6V62_04145 [Paludibacteraceae bacterium]|nr:hypothetical protein [Paludibacteraceae bacterium]
MKKLVLYACMCLGAIAMLSSCKGDEPNGENNDPSGEQPLPTTNVPAIHYQSVDMGLPSGLLWAASNIGAEKPEKYGSYFAWAEINTKTAFNYDNYKWYDSEGNVLKYNFDETYGKVDLLNELENYDDVAYVATGGQWRMPTQDEYNELISSCDAEETTLNGVKGYLLTSRNNGQTLFFPLAGYQDDEGLKNEAGGAYLWTRNIDPTDATYALTMSMGYGSVSDSFSPRIEGLSVRGVQLKTATPEPETPENPETPETPDPVVPEEPEQPEEEKLYVDLGLSSGVKWGIYNVGAFAVEASGSYYAWGETTSKITYTWENYQWCNGTETSLTKYNSDDNKKQLELDDDAAHAMLGGKWRIPTRAEWEELRSSCTWTWTEVEGVKGYKVQSKVNENYIFLPAVGNYKDGDWLGYNEFGFYTSSTLYPTDTRHVISYQITPLVHNVTSLHRRRGLPIRPVMD